MKLLSFLLLSRWIAFATSSFPVPLSPVMRVVVSVGAAFFMSSTTCAIEDDD
jgi:hypothetical protein